MLGGVQKTEIETKWTQNELNKKYGVDTKQVFKIFF